MANQTIDGQVYEDSGVWKIRFVDTECDNKVLLGQMVWSGVHAGQAAVYHSDCDDTYYGQVDWSTNPAKFKVTIPDDCCVAVGLLNDYTECSGIDIFAYGGSALVNDGISESENDCEYCTSTPTTVDVTFRDMVACTGCYASGYLYAKNTVNFTMNDTFELTQCTPTTGGYCCWDKTITDGASWALYNDSDCTDLIGGDDSDVYIIVCVIVPVSPRLVRVRMCAEAGPPYGFFGTKERDSDCANITE